MVIGKRGTDAVVQCGKEMAEFMDAEKEDERERIGNAGLERGDEVRECGEGEGAPCPENPCCNCSEKGCCKKT